MAMYEVGTVTGAANQTKVTGISTKWSETALGIQEGRFLSFIAMEVQICMPSNLLIMTLN